MSKLFKQPSLKSNRVSPLRVNVAYGTQHLFDKPRALRFSVVIIWLLVKTVEQLSTQTKFLHQVDFRMRLIYLLKTDYVWMVQLAHDVDFFAQLLQALLCVDKAEIEALHRVFEPGCLVSNKTNHARYSRP